MKIKYLIFPPLILLISACFSTSKITNNEQKEPTTVGILVVSNRISVAKSGRQGIIVSATTKGNRFKDALYTVEANITDPTDELIEIYRETFDTIGKQYFFIEDKINLDDFPSTFTRDKRYSTYDYSSLKEKYDINEFLLVTLDYGLLVNYNGLIETGKHGYCKIISKLINLHNNKVLYRGRNIGSEKLEGVWNSGRNYNYPFLEKAIKIMLASGLEEERDKLAERWEDIK